MAVPVRVEGPEDAYKHHVWLGEGNCLGYVNPVFWRGTFDKGWVQRSEDRLTAFSVRLGQLVETDPELQKILSEELADRPDEEAERLGRIEHLRKESN